MSCRQHESHDGRSVIVSQSRGSCNRKLLKRESSPSGATHRIGVVLLLAALATSNFVTLRVADVPLLGAIDDDRLALQAAAGASFGRDPARQCRGTARDSDRAVLDSGCAQRLLVLDVPIRKRVRESGTAFESCFLAAPRLRRDQHAPARLAAARRRRGDGAVVERLAAAATVGIARANTRFLAQSGGLFAAAVLAAAIAWYAVPEREHLFSKGAEQSSREQYGSNPFIESIEIARCIRERTTPTNRIALLGSEPQICFYSGRNSVSGFIYMYPLV